MTLRHFEVFAAVCETGSMTAAAKKLFVSQPAISLAIKEMEENYSVQLFDRSSRKLCLTNFGHEIYAYCTRVLSLLDEMNLIVTEQKAYTTLRIGTGIVFGELYLPQIINKFYSINENCRVHVVVEATEIIEPLLTDGALDICITEGASKSEKLQHHELSHASLVAVCKKDHPIAQEKIVTAEMLASQNLLLRQRHSQTRDAIDVYFASHNLSPRPLWESISALALLNAASLGIGIAIIPYDHFKILNIKDLVILPVLDLNSTRHIDFVYRKNIALSPLANEFIAFTSNYINEV